MSAPDASRRSFLGRLLGGGIVTAALAIAGAAVAYLYPPARRGDRGRVRIGGAGELPVSTGKLTLVHGEPAWLVRLVGGFVAFSAVCTHKGCVVRWEGERRVFRCPCHEGVFDEHGNVVSGLPRRPLERFRVGIVGGDVYVSLDERRSG